MPDTTDRTILNALQGGFPVTERPFAEVSATLGLDEEAVIERIGDMLSRGLLSRFGPMFNAEEMGGAFCLCAMSVPDADFEKAVAHVNARPEVAHNYRRQHELNVWFVLATETPEEIAAAIAEIEAGTGLEVFAFPKLREFFIGLKVNA